MEYTFMRFTVNINRAGYPDDDGKAWAEEVKQALLEAARDFDIDATVEETTA